MNEPTRAFGFPRATRDSRGLSAAIVVIGLALASACGAPPETADAGSETAVADSAADSSAARPEDTEVWEPEPDIVAPGPDNAPPADAIVLFDGTDLAAWEHEDGRDAEWAVADGVLTVAPGTGDIRTRAGFGNVQFHIEWRTPPEISGEGQGRGNSGIFFMERYELQVLDSYENLTYANGQAGSIYKQHPPLVNASRPPGVWQRYDVVFTAPRFAADGSLVSPASMTAFHNGVLIQNDAELRGPTVFIGQPEYDAHPERAALMLQDHGNPVSFRNVWVREIAPGP